MSIDLHIHLIPGIDDGASSLTESRSMLERLARNGCIRVVATPHLMEPLVPEYLHEAQEGLTQLQSLAGPLGIAIDLGFEHMLAPDTAERLVAGEQSTMAGSRAVLVELPFSRWPSHTSASLLSLRKKGYRAILAHPERYVDAERNPDLVFDAALQGAVLQITSGSLAGLYGKRVTSLARLLLEGAIQREMPVVLASDAHSAGQRLTSVQEGHSWIRREIAQGAMVLDWATNYVPEMILGDKECLPFTSWLHSNGIHANQEPPQMLTDTAKARRPLWKRFRSIRGSL